MENKIKSFLVDIKGNEEWKEIYDYITNLEQINKDHQELNGKLREEIARLKEEYVFLQNASDEYEDELKERESELEGRIQKAIDYLENAVPFRYFELRDILIYGEVRNNER